MHSKLPLDFIFLTPDTMNQGTAVIKLRSALFLIGRNIGLSPIWMRMHTDQEVILVFLCPTT